MDVDGWVVRRSGGVTQRANSVAPLSAPADVSAALARVEELYRADGLPAIFQLGPTVAPADLDARLAARGYGYGSPTSVEVADVAAVLARLPSGPAVDVAGEPDDRWMDLWWAVDGRGDDSALALARGILTAGPALYGSVLAGGEVVAVARLAVVGEWGGVYCMAVRPEARRRGLGSVVLRGVLSHAAERGVRRCWLQVRAENSAARALYAGAGFTTAARYHYRTLPIR